MKIYLKYLGYGFLILFIYCPVHFCMSLLKALVYTSYHEEIHIYKLGLSTINHDVIIKIFAAIFVLYILILLGFFITGRAFSFGNEKTIYAFIFFLLPNVIFHFLINLLFYSNDIMLALNWFLELFGDTFFHDTSIAYTLVNSRLLACIFTDIPFIVAFLGGLAKRKKEAKKQKGVEAYD